MAVFDVSNPHLVSLQDVEPSIESGWIAQYRGTGFISRWIEYGTGGCHSHSAMLRRNGGGVDVLEIREWIGGRATPLASEVERYPGMIDVFSVDKRFPEYRGPLAARYMRLLTGNDYGYWGVLKLGLMKLPLIRRLWPFDTDDLLRTNAAPFCSHAVCAAMRLGGNVDPVPRKRDDRVSPNDLTWSCALFYEFTLT